MRKLRPKAVALSALAVCVCLVMAGVAYGASNHGISGTVYSGCSGSGPWFNSSTQRVKSGTGLIKAQFNTVNDGGLTFRLLSPSGVQIGSQQTWTKTEIGIWRTFTSSYGGGKSFYNSFRDTNYSCPDNQTNYNFDGTEYY